MLEQIISRLRAFRDERGWRQFHTPKDLAISVSVEAGELLEIFQWQEPRQQLSEKEAASVREEAADVFLYLLMLCEALDIDLAEAANRKIDANERRFPVETSFGVAKPPSDGD